jgi:hypothetical protein
MTTMITPNRTTSLTATPEPSGEKATARHGNLLKAYGVRCRPAFPAHRHPPYRPPSRRRPVVTTSTCSPVDRPPARRPVTPQSDYPSKTFSVPWSATRAHAPAACPWPWKSLRLWPVKVPTSQGAC